jgi:2,4-diketo-3-deoxy-L-fuconate hydrolase
MIFSCATIVSYVSHVWRLEHGDVIATGTPPGIGAARKPPFS